MKVNPQSRAQTPAPEQEKFASSPTQNASSSTSTTTASTTQQVFAATHIPSTNTPPAAAQPAGMPRVQKAATDLGIFVPKLMSKAFKSVYDAAHTAIKSPENQAWMAKTGSYSPAAKLAVDKFAALVATKSANTPASAAARSSFAEGPLTDFEKFAWLQFVDETTPSYDRELMPVNEWKNVETQELHDVLQTEPGFARFINKPEGVKFIHELKNAINEKYGEMLGTDKGMALVFRFDSAYSAVAHTAVASLWRDVNGKLCMGVAHQESVPPSDAKNDVPRGVVYDKFDTSPTFPGGFAPVVESMRLAGLPSVNLFPCPHPQAIVPAVQELAGEEKANPYGATDNWRNNNRGKLPSGRPFETCFNVTHRVLAQLYGTQASQAPLLPDVLIAMRPFVSIPEDQFNTVTIASGKDKKDIALRQIADQPADDIVKTFLQIGESWGKAGKWDVRGQSQTSKRSVILNPGQGISLPQGANALKFIADPAMLMLNGRPVKAGIAFSKEEAEMMVYTGKEKSRPILFVVAVPERAKL